MCASDARVEIVLPSVISRGSPIESEEKIVLARYHDGSRQAYGFSREFSIGANAKGEFCGAYDIPFYVALQQIAKACSRDVFHDVLVSLGMRKARRRRWRARAN